MTATLIKTLLVIYLFFLICLVSVSVYSLFFIYITLLFLFQIVFCSFLYVFCLFCYLVFIRSVFPVTLSLCYSVFPLILSLCHSVSFLSIFPLILPLCHSVYSLSFCLFSCFCRTFSPPTFPFILASFLLFHLFIF